MAFDGLLVTEIFHSIQGETSLSGLRCSFVRLTGCNLRCVYCDSAYAFHGGRRMSLDEVVDEVRPHGARDVLITGGEPLLQRQTPALARRLREDGFRVSIETHGEVSIEAVAGVARVVMDLKAPDSGMCRGGFEHNFRWLREGDELKVVVASERDYEWARDWVRSGRLPRCEVLFSPAVPAPGMPGKFPGLSPARLAERVLEDRLPVRVQLQLHKQLWGDRRGV